MRQLVALLLAASVTGSLLAQEFFRYQNEQGQTVMDNTIPAPYVAGGYDVLDARGRLIERVPPQQAPTGEEAEDNLGREQAQANDQLLLTSYSNIDEIEAHRLRKRQAVEREISIIRSDQGVMGDEFDRVEAEYQALVEREREIPATLTQSRKDLTSTLSLLDQQLLRRTRELDEIDREFDARAARFLQLKAQL